MKNKYLTLLALGFLTGALFLSNQAFAQESPKEITMTGTVDAIAFDNTGNVIQIALSVEKQVNENDIEFVNYIIINDKKGKELFHMIGKTVQVTGKVSDKDGNKYITVKEYKVLTPNES